MLRDFVEAHRGEILALARLRFARRDAPRATEAKITTGLAFFLDQLREGLRRAPSQELDHREIADSAAQHGRSLFEHGLTVAQVVHDYGELCQVITGLSVDHHVALDADEFRTLNLCLDDAIAGAVTEFSRLRERTIADAGTERLGYLAHEMRNVVGTAILTFGSSRKGTVAPGGSIGVVHAGLGLAICQKAAKAMDGELRICDLPGKGCIFTIDLPEQRPPPTSIFDRMNKPKDGATGTASGSALRQADSSSAMLVSGVTG